MCLLSFAAASIRPQSGEKSHTLRGQVVDGVTGRPLAGVEIGLDHTPWQAVSETTTPDSQGRFVFSGLAAGDYLLFASRRDFGRIYFGELPYRSVQVIHIKPGQSGKDVLFPVMPRSTLSGSVRDELDDPVAGAQVTVYGGVWNDGRVKLGFVSEGRTDDRGRFRIGSLKPGGYFVCAKTGSLMAGENAAPTAGPVDFAARSEPRFYAQTCVPDTSKSLLAPLEIAPGQQAEMQLTLRSASALSLRGRALHVPPEIGIAIRLMREDAVEATEPLLAYTNAEGKFEFRGVSPGRYHLETGVNWQPPDGPPKRLIARLPVELHSSLDGIELPLEAPSVVEVVLHGADADKTEPEAPQIGLRSPSGSVWAYREHQGPPRFAEMSPGTFWLVAHTHRGTCVVSAKLGQQDALKGPVTVKPGAAQLDVTLSKDCGGIQARVISDGKPVPDAKVLLVLSGSAKDPGDMVTEFADDQGEATFEGIAPGRYFLWAWQVDPAGSFVGPANLGKVEGQATAVVVSKGEPVKIDVPVLSREDLAK